MWWRLLLLRLLEWAVRPMSDLTTIHYTNATEMSELREAGMIHTTEGEWVLYQINLYSITVLCTGRLDRVCHNSSSRESQ